MKPQARLFRIVIAAALMLTVNPIVAGPALALGRKKKSREPSPPQKQLKEIVEGQLATTDGKNLRGKRFLALYHEALARHFPLESEDSKKGVELLTALVAGAVQGELIDELANAPEGMSRADIYGQTRYLEDKAGVDHYLEELTEYGILLNDRDMFIRGPNMDKAVTAIECLRGALAVLDGQDWKAVHKNR